MNNPDKQQTGNPSELIVLFKPEYDILVGESGEIVAGKGKEPRMVNDLLKKHKAVIKPIGSKTRNNQQETTLPAGMRFFTIREAENPEELRLELLKTGVVDSAYFKPPAEDPGTEE